MADKTWKAVERRIAERLGTQRVVCSGVRGEGDIEHPTYHIEVKHRKKIPFFAVWKLTKAEAKKTKRKPLVIIHEKHSPTMLVMMDFAEFVKFHEMEDVKDKLMEANLQIIELKNMSEALKDKDLEKSTSH